MLKKLFSLLLLSLLLGVPVYAQQAQEVKETSVIEEQTLEVVVPVVEEQILGEDVPVLDNTELSQEKALDQVELKQEEVVAQVKASAQEGMVSLNFRDVDIKDVLRVLSYESKVNIVSGPEVIGLVTIQLDDVPWKKALDVVVSTYGYAYDQRGNIINVTTIENLKKRREDAMVLDDQEPLMTKTFVLNYAKAADIIESISKMKTERGNINYDERTNTIIVRDISSNIEAIDEVIVQLDQPTPQVLIEAKIVEVRVGNEEALGIDWNLSASAKGVLRPTTFPFDDGTASKFLPDVTEEAIGESFSYGLLNFSAFETTMQMINSSSDINIVSSPKIVTLDNQMARIVVGDQYPFAQYTYNSDQAQMQISGWEYKDIGVVFEVTPHVNNAGMVTLDLKPSISAISGSVLVDPKLTAEVPLLTTREATTSVMIKDGDTLVIGGLISDTETDAESKVPFLGDIPLLGRLFRHNSKDKAKIDLLIFITPHIITPEVKSEE